MPILTCDGPIDGATPFDRVLYFESMLFDRAQPGMLTDRLSLENRFEFVNDPERFLDNVTGNLDLFEFELKQLAKADKSETLATTLICMHDNNLLLKASKEFVARFKAIVAKFQVKIVLSISVPELLAKEQAVDYLVAHIHYGYSGLLFGAILSKNEADMPWCLLAQERAEAPVFSTKKEAIEVSSFLIASAMAQLNDKVLLSSNCRFKTNFTKYGGQGIDFFPKLVKKNFFEIFDFNRKSTQTVLSFNWAPKQLDLPAEESGRWTCDICGVTAKLSERENYTKFGHTYCSTKCLADHRRRNWT